MSLLDVPTGQRFESVRFHLLDANHERLAPETLDALSAPSVSWATDRASRGLTGLQMGEIDADIIDADAHRIRVVHVVEGEPERSLGVYALDAAPRRPGTLQDLVTVDASDERALLDQPAPAYSASSGVNVGTEMVAAATAAGFPADLIDAVATDQVTADPISWPVGTTYLRRLTDLTLLAGFLPPHMSHDGRLRLRAVPQISETAVDIRYRLDQTSRVVAGSVSVAAERLRSHNRWLVVSESPGATPVIGVYDLPDEHPLSAATTGSVRTRRVDIPGLTDTTEAEAAARAAALRDPSTVGKWVEFDTPIDPRHELFATVEFDGELYRELSVSFTAVAGGTMRHRLERVYPDA